MNNMKQQVLSMHNYASVHKQFPQREENGLSWRVHLLPFMGENNLYDSFHLDEPWDSPHNIQLLESMPAFYACPSVDLPPGYTVYKIPYTDIATNPASQDLALFDTSGQPVDFPQITDGTSNTIALLEVDAVAAVEWTKPADWEYDPSNPVHDLGGVHPGVFLSAFADGSIQSLPDDTSPEGMKAMITREAGDTPPINFGY